MLKVQDLSVSLGGQNRVNQVSLEAKNGELLAIIGPNGAGKSTLLKLISGELQTDVGQVLIADIHRADWHRQQLAQQMAVMGQTPQLSFDFTVRELVELSRSPYRGKESAKQKGNIVKKAIALAGLDDFEERSVLNLSGGERQRAFFAKTVGQLMTPGDTLPGQNRLLLLDEPTSALDLSQQLRVMGTARKVADAGGTVITVLHDLNLAAAFADKIAVMVAGRLMAIDVPNLVLQAQMLSLWYDCPVCVTECKQTNTPVISLQR